MPERGPAPSRPLVSSLRWALGAAHLALGPLVLRAVELDLRARSGRPPPGVIRIGGLTGSEHQQLTLGQGRVVGAGMLTGKGVVLRFTDDGLHIEIGSLQLEGVTALRERVLPAKQAMAHDAMIAAAEALRDSLDVTPLQDSIRSRSVRLGAASLALGRAA